MPRSVNALDGGAHYAKWNRSIRTQNAIVICMHMNDEHRKAYEGKPHVWFDEERQNLSALYSSRGAVKTAGYKNYAGCHPADAAASFQPGSHQVFQPSIQRIFQPNIQLTSSHVSSQASRNSSGNHVKLSQNARIRSTGRECVQVISTKFAAPLNVDTCRIPRLMANHSQRFFFIRSF